MTWLRNQEECSGVEDREHLPLHERLSKYICEEAQLIADLDYYNTKGYGMLLDPYQPTKEYDVVIEERDQLDYYVGTNTLPPAEYERWFNQGTRIEHYEAN